MPHTIRRFWDWISVSDCSKEIDCIINNPLKIFISSGCGVGKEKYNQIRKALKEQVEKTGFAKVFLFEESGHASTQTAEQIYLRELDESHICIFLIDNADGIPDGVVPEIQRAKTKGIKSLYIFCTERSSEATWVEKELRGAKGEKYYCISSFDDFVKEGYRSLITDIIDIYHKYCRKWLVDPEFDIPQQEIAEISDIGTESLKKSLVADLDRTKIHLSASVYENPREIKHSSAFDECCEQVLQLVLGEKTISEYNPSLLLLELEKMQSAKLHGIIQLRWKAIIAYYADKLDDCLSYLEQALIKARNDCVFFVR